MGFGGGGCRHGQSHEEPVALGDVCGSVVGGVFSAVGPGLGPIEVDECSASPRVGKFGEIIPSAVHVSLLKNSLSASLVTYTICRDSRGWPNLECPENRKMTAPRILMPWLFAACICMVTGIRLSSHRPRQRITFMLARQL